MNVIDIEAEENKPSKLRADWSPIRFMDISPTLFTRLKELKTVNKGVAISDPDHGAVVQVKFNKNTDPGSMYSATMDTKDVALTEEQKQYVVIQKYPDGMSKTVRGKNGLPAQFEYIRCVNSRDDMIKSLRRNGYYGESEQASAAAHSFDDPLLSREEKVAKMDAEAQVEVIDMDSVFAGAPTSPVVSPSDNAVTVASEPVVASSTPAKVAAKPKGDEPSDDCPTAFGEFANTMVCFSECAVTAACRTATNNSQLAQPQTTQPSKKEVAPVDDDDDTV